MELVRQDFPVGLSVSVGDRTTGGCDTLLKSVLPVPRAREDSLFDYVGGANDTNAVKKDTWARHGVE